MGEELILSVEYMVGGEDTAGQDQWTVDLGGVEGLLELVVRAKYLILRSGQCLRVLSVVPNEWPWQ